MASRVHSSITEVLWIRKKFFEPNLDPDPWILKSELLILIRILSGQFCGR
jgi:hypothetical protein